MKFSWCDYLKDYRKEDVSREEMVIKEKWSKTASIIKEAFSDQYVTKTEAVEKIKTEFVDDKVAPKTIDISFLKENLKYVCDKVRDLAEGDIRIIINNGDKVKNSGSSEMDESAKAKKLTEGKKKAKKDDDEGEEDDEEKKSKKKDDDEDEKEPKKKSHHKKEKDDEEEDSEVIIDEPKAVEDIVGDEGVKEVKINFNKEKMEVEISEGDKPADIYEVTEDSAEEIIQFLKDFYENNDYAVDYEEDGENTISDKDKDLKGKEDVESGNEEGILDVNPEDTFDMKDFGMGESDKSKLSWKEFLAENQYHEVVKEDEVPTAPVTQSTEDQLSSAIEECVGKIATYKGTMWRVEKCEGDDLTLVNNAGETITAKKGEVELEPGEDVEEGKYCDTTKTGTGAMGHDMGEADDDTEKEEPMGEAVKYVAMKKKESSGSYTKTGGQKVNMPKAIPTPKSPKKDSKPVPTGSYTKTGGQKVKEPQAQAMPKSPKKDVKGVSTGSYTKQSNMKTLQTQAQGMAKSPKKDVKAAPSGSYTKTGGQKVKMPQAQGMPKAPKK